MKRDRENEIIKDWDTAVHTGPTDHRGNPIYIPPVITEEILLDRWKRQRKRVADRLRQLRRDRDVLCGWKPIGIFRCPTELPMYRTTDHDHSPSNVTYVDEEAYTAADDHSPSESE